MVLRGLRAQGVYPHPVVFSSEAEAPPWDALQQVAELGEDKAWLCTRMWGGKERGKEPRGQGGARGLQEGGLME